MMQPMKNLKHTQNEFFVSIWNLNLILLSLGARKSLKLNWIILKIAYIQKFRKG